MSRAFDSSNPYLWDRADVVRVQVVGDDEGTPISDPVIVQSNVACRMDQITSRRRDISERTVLTESHMNYAICLMPTGTNIQSRDRIRLRRNGDEYQIDEIDEAYGAAGVHHLEVTCYRVKGAT